MNNKVTMKDIADKLHISINAVSLALNDKEGVSQNLRIQILEAAVEMNYPLKKLNSKITLKNKTITVMIEEKKKNDTYYYLDILSHIEKEASLFGYRITIITLVFLNVSRITMLQVLSSLVKLMMK